ncbi:MAG: hypothetical protein RI964_1103 [Pseudomonadota bacterium]|jgi:hypothetical protein
MRNYLTIFGVLTSLSLLSACGNQHALSSPITTCKAVTQVLAGNKTVLWHGERQTEQKGEQLQVTLDFSLADQPPNAVSQAVCVYGLSSQDMDYRNAMGEYANTPTRMLINGRAIPSNDLVQAVNRVTADVINAVSQNAAQQLNQLNGQK